MHKNFRAAYQAAKALRDHYKDLFETSVGELRFERLQNEELLALIDEIMVLTDDQLVKAIIENSKNRYNLNKICHAKKLFK